MGSSIIPFYNVRPADIAFVIQIDDNWSFPEYLERIIDTAKGFNSDCKIFGLPYKYDMYFSNGRGSIMRARGFCAEIVNGYELFQKHRYVIPLGTETFVTLWNKTFNIHYDRILVKLPDAVLGEEQIGGKAYLRRGNDLRAKKLPLRGKHICIRKAGVDENECECQIVENKKKSIRAFLDEQYGKDCDDIFLVTPLQNWESKWRYIVFNKKICSAKSCSLDKSLEPDKETIHSYIEEITGFNNKATPFILTVGVEYNKKKKRSVTHLLEVASVNMADLENVISAKLPSIATANYLVAIQPV